MIGDDSILFSAPIDADCDGLPFCCQWRLRFSLGLNISVQAVLVIVDSTRLPARVTRVPSSMH